MIEFFELVCWFTTREQTRLGLSLLFNPLQQKRVFGGAAAYCAITQLVYTAEVSENRV
jgi:hypothetical protein